MGSVSWQTVAVLATLIVANGAIVLFAVKTMLNDSKIHTDEKFNELEEKISGISTESIKIERQLLTFKADLPKEYVMRNDWIRFSSVIDAKQDGLGAEVRTLSVQIQLIIDRMKKSNGVNDE